MIFWIPGTPKSWARPGLKRRGGYYPTKQHKDSMSWREAIQVASKKAGPDPCDYLPILPIELRLIFVIKRPKSHFRTGGNSHLVKDSAELFHMQTPDLDRLVSLVLDEFQKAMRFLNDAQVTKFTTRKVWHERFEGCLAEIKPASKADALLTLDEIAKIDPR